VPLGVQIRTEEIMKQSIKVIVIAINDG